MKLLWNSLVVAAACLSLSCSKLSSVNAELPPGAYEELLANATEVLLITVTSVENQAMDTTDDVAPLCAQDTTVTADIMGVNDTATGLSSGADVEFSSYMLVGVSEDEDGSYWMGAGDNETLSQCQGWTGAQAPPVLYPGWCGYVYLILDNSDVFQPAAYGRSFVEGAPECPGGIKPEEDEQSDTYNSTDSDHHADDGHDQDHADEGTTSDKGSGGSEKSAVQSGGRTNSQLLATGAAALLGSTCFLML